MLSLISNITKIAILYCDKGLTVAMQTCSKETLLKKIFNENWHKDQRYQLPAWSLKGSCELILH